MKDEKNTAVRVFLSYAWETDDYRKWVRRFASRLRKDGVNARLDAWHNRRSFVNFMNSEVRNADKIIIVASPLYRKKVHLIEDGEALSGVGWESQLVTSSLFEGTLAEEDVIPVLARGNWGDSSPTYLSTIPHYDLSEDSAFEANYRLLLQRVLDCQEVEPPIGEIPQSISPATTPPLHGEEPIPSAAEDIAPGDGDAGGTCADIAIKAFRGDITELINVIQRDFEFDGFSFDIQGQSGTQHNN